MPTVSIYIRKDDYSKYLDIENPSEFIHNALNPEERLSPKGGWIKDGTGWKPNPKPIKTPKNLATNLEPYLVKKKVEFESNIVSNPKLCKHGADPKLCKFSKPGKPCK